jgi:hypothetical protein
MATLNAPAFGYDRPTFQTALQKTGQNRLRERVGSFGRGQKAA